MKLWTALFVLSMGLATVAPAAATPITVTVTALHGDGAAFPDLWLGLIADDRAAEPPAWVAKTGADGVAHFTVEIPADSENVFVKVAGPGAAGLAPIGQRMSVLEQAEQILPNYSFPEFLTIPLEDGVSEYATTLTLCPSVRVSVQLVDGNGQPIAGGAMTQISDIGMDADANRNGESDPLSIGGIKQGGSADVMILGPNSPKWMVIHLTPVQTVADVDLGQIHIPPYQPGTVPLHLTVNGRDRLQTRAVESVQSAVTIFSVDGQSAIIFAHNSATGEMAHWPTNETPETPRLDPGTYYIAPGVLGTSRANLLRQLLLNGVDVNAAGVPKIVAVAGQEVQMTIDAAAAEQAILTAAGQ